MSIENIAVITSFLSPEMGSKVILTLDLNQQATIALNMLNQKSVNRQNIEKLESHIKSALECLVGGQSHFQKTFNLVPADLKRKLLNVLSKANAEGYKNFRKNIIIFEDLKLLNEEELKILINSVSMDMLAKALTGSDKQLAQRFIDSMPNSTRELFKQTVELKGKTFTPREIEESQDLMLQTIVDLETDTMFNLKARIRV
jgi:flagellar motor switch protein FliG